MLVSETSGAASPLTRFRGLASVPEKRTRVLEVALPCPKIKTNPRKDGSS